jgi:hypothetical protein
MADGWRICAPLNARSEESSQLTGESNVENTNRRSPGSHALKSLFGLMRFCYLLKSRFTNRSQAVDLIRIDKVDTLFS